MAIELHHLHPSHDEESREEQYRLAVYSKENGWEVDDEEVYKTAEIEA